MQIQINGEHHQLEHSVSLNQLLERLKINSQSVAVELNRQVVAKEVWPSTMIYEGDALEIVQFVGGGS